MTTEEKEYLSNELKKINLFNISLSYHVQHKNIEYNPNNIFKVLLSENIEQLIVEYNETTTNREKDCRVLLRSDFNVPTTIIEYNKVKLCDANLCFVISLQTKRIITVYFNIQSDNHNTINWNRYNKDLQIIY